MLWHVVTRLVFKLVYKTQYLTPIYLGSSSRCYAYGLNGCKHVDKAHLAAFLFCFRGCGSPLTRSSVGSPPAQLSASLRVRRFASALRVCGQATQPTVVVAKGKIANCRADARLFAHPKVLLHNPAEYRDRMAGDACGSMQPF